jgi:hypothetical protein
MLWRDQNSLSKARRAHLTLNRKLERESDLIAIHRHDLLHNQQHLLLLGKRAVTPGFKWLALAPI